ncbi:MAG: hypothetical protein JWM57_2442 [Phycisphaerales bacterium]|nr:hypothetical protein [Phycisphaerales bacterium]
MTVLSRAFAPPPDAARPPTTPTAPAPAPQSALERAIHAPETPFTRWLVRWRFFFFAGLVALLAVQFNGQWRIGLDSSIYRGVADSLAAGHGYYFAGRPQTQIYPGLPYLLAAMQRVFHTTSLLPPLILFNLLGLLTLAGVYQLIKLRYPLWIAVVVVCGVGMNSRFLQQPQEIMTDTPFLCAVVWAMLGWEWLGLAKTRRCMTTAIALLAGSLLIAASMRPTFWVLGAAWAIAAAWNVVRWRERRSLISLGLLVLVFIAFMAVDPRGRGMGLFNGAYEKQLLVILPDLPHRVMANAGTLFTHEIPEAFFSENLYKAAVPFSILLLIGAIVVSWRQPLWGLQVLILTAVMLAISDVPRYYLMVLPTLWLGYVLAILWLTSKARPVVRDLLLFGLFSLANVQNLGGALSLATEQHASPFLDKYKRGTYQPLIATADMLKQKLGPKDVAIGPMAQILSYLSGRQVVNGRLIGFDTQKPAKYPMLIEAAKPAFVIGPVSEYDKKDTDLYKLLLHGVVVPGKLVGRSGDLWLAEAKVVLPTGDWRSSPRIAKFYPVGPSRHANMSPQEAANRKTKADRAERAANKARKEIKAKRAERAAYLERKARKLKRQQNPSTQPTSLLWHAGPGPTFIGGIGGFASPAVLLSMPG